MNNLRQLGAACAVVFLCFTNAQASLVGDTVVIEHHFPDVGTIFSSESVFVEAGTSDTVLGASSVYTVNVEANSILVAHSGIFPDITLDDASFNGLIVSDLDWIGSPEEVITGAIFDTNLVGWDDSRFSFTDDSVLFNWASLTIATSTFFNVTLETGYSVIPAPPALWLFGSGFVGLVGVARRKKTARQNV